MKKNPTLTRLRDALTRDGGFTLIEILGVMVIVGLLAAVAVPAISKWREKAYVTALKTDARALAQGIEAHRIDSAEYPTTVANDGQPFHGLTDSNTVAAYTADGEQFEFTLASTRTPTRVCYDSAAGTLTTCTTGDAGGDETSGVSSSYTRDGENVIIRAEGLEPFHGYLLTVWADIGGGEPVALHENTPISPQPDGTFTRSYPFWLHGQDARIEIRDISGAVVTSASGNW